MNDLIKFLNQRIPLSEEEFNYLKTEVEILNVRKNQILLSEGLVSSEFYFVIQGCLRLYYTSDSEEKTAYFYTENMFASSYESFNKRIPAKHAIAAVEDSILTVFKYEQVERFLSFSPRFEILARIVMEEELAACQSIISSFVTQNAEMRYLSLLRDERKLTERIPQYQIATYLGVSPETLSRIRKRIVRK